MSPESLLGHFLAQCNNEINKRSATILELRATTAITALELACKNTDVKKASDDILLLQVIRDDLTREHEWIGFKRKEYNNAIVENKERFDQN